MNVKNIFTVITLIVVIFGCKKTADTEHSGAKADFIVSIEVIAQKDDNFALYYTTDGSINFFNIPPVFQSFKGSPKLQKIKFVIPNLVIPSQFRIDFGMKQDQPDVILKAITMEHAGNIYTIPGAHIFDYFEIDGNTCTANAATGAITAKIKNGKRQTPSIYPNPKLLRQKINTLTK